MQRYFIPTDAVKDDRLEITKDDAHHIIRVMRMKVGDFILCSLPDGKTAKCKIEEIANDRVGVYVVEWMDDNQELPVQVTIAQGMPKGDKLELVVQKGTELGAKTFLPFFASRSIVKWDEKKGRKKVERLNKISKEAAEQSHRNHVPNVQLPISFQKLIEESKSYHVKLVAFEEDAKAGETSMLVRTLKGLNKNDSILVVFGPEGGLTDKEINLLIENGFLTCGLGPRILRTETAPLYFLSAVSYQTELME